MLPRLPPGMITQSGTWGLLNVWVGTLQPQQEPAERGREWVRCACAVTGTKKENQVQFLKCHSRR